MGLGMLTSSVFSAGSYTGLAIHEVLNEFDCFPGTTKVAAIASPPEMLRLATGERRVVLLHCLEDRLCVWRPDSQTSEWRPACGEINL